MGECRHAQIIEIEKMLSSIRQKGQIWRWLLMVLGVLIIVGSLVYSNFLARQLADEERKRAKHLLFTYRVLLRTPEYDDAAMLTDITNLLQENTTIPAILVDSAGTALVGRNFDPTLDEDQSFLDAEVKKLRSEGVLPLRFDDGGGTQFGIYYRNSRLLVQLTYFPYWQLLLIAAYIGLGYILFRSARQAQENRVWVGMAKETAHQLGTPISALMGWIEYLKSSYPDDEAMQEVVRELGKDTNRLNLVSDRFSKIGSAPELVTVNLRHQLEECRSYMQVRVPRKVKISFPELDAAPILGNINAHLFDWVIENLLRNAVDAMDGAGDISVDLYEDGRWVVIDVTDTGKGIAQNKHQAVFRPGYTTKKRGWGLGLSLAQRIIETYHLGRILVKRSAPNEGATFAIMLPKVK